MKLYFRASASSTNRAAASAFASSPYLAITCTPTGNPPSAMRGNVDAGTPISVQSRLKRASPVEPSPLAPRPALKSQQHVESSKILSSAFARGRAMRAPRHNRPEACPCFRRASRAATAPWRRNFAIFPGQRLMRLEFLHGRLMRHASAKFPAAPGPNRRSCPFRRLCAIRSASSPPASGAPAKSWVTTPMRGVGARPAAAIPSGPSSPQALRESDAGGEQPDSIQRPGKAFHADRRQQPERTA